MIWEFYLCGSSYKIALWLKKKNEAYMKEMNPEILQCLSIDNAYTDNAYLIP